MDEQDRAPELLPNLSLEAMLRFGEIDLDIEEAIRSMDEYLDDLDSGERTLVILYMRWAYMDGYTAGYTDCKASADPT